RHTAALRRAVSKARSSSVRISRCDPTLRRERAGQSRSLVLESLPDPKCCEHKYRAHESSNNIAQRNCDRVDVRQQGKKAENKSADESADETHAQISQETKSPTFPGYEEAREASSNETYDDPNDKLGE